MINVEKVSAENNKSKSDLIYTIIQDNVLPCNSKGDDAFTNLQSLTDHLNKSNLLESHSWNKKSSNKLYKIDNDVEYEEEESRDVGIIKRQCQFYFKLELNLREKFN